MAIQRQSAQTQAGQLAQRASESSNESAGENENGPIENEPMNGWRWKAIGIKWDPYSNPYTDSNPEPAQWTLTDIDHLTRTHPLSICLLHNGPEEEREGEREHYLSSAERARRRDHN